MIQMKKGNETMTVVIVMVLVLIFAGGTLYAFSGRLENAPKSIAGFFPEKCKTTGKTPDEYLQAITLEVSKGQPDVPKALAINTEMMACFPDAKLPPDLSKYLVEKGIMKAIDFDKLLREGTAKSLKDAMNIYLNSRNLMKPAQLEPNQLTLFARAVYYYGTPDYANALIDELLKKKSATDAQRAEALTIRASLLGKEGKASDSLNLFRQVVADYGSKTADKELSPFVGRAMLVVGKADNNVEMQKKGMQVLDETVKAPANNYLFGYSDYYLSTFELKEAQAPGGNAQQAAQSFEKLLTKTDSKNSVFFTDSVQAYSQIDQSLRTFKDCKFETQLTDLCICKGTFDILPNKDSSYCCSPDKSATECLCKSIHTCDGYKKRADCLADPCGFRGAAAGAYWNCDWQEDRCIEISGGGMSN